jgi:hypothetical protein
VEDLIDCSIYLELLKKTALKILICRYFPHCQI